ncbi:MAG: S8 family serine peptidase [Phycisphaerae bacterium]
MKARRLTFCLAAVTAILPIVRAEAESARHFVRHTGARYEMYRSTDEFAVEFSNADVVDPCTKRLASKGIAVVDDSLEPTSRIRVMRVYKADAKQRDLVRLDPEVVDVQPVYYMPDVPHPFLSTGSIIVRVADSLSDQDVASLWYDYRLSLVESIDGLPGVYCVKPVDRDDDEVFRAEVMSEDSRVVYAQPNFRSPGYLQQVTPADQFFGRQWHLENSGQDGGTQGADISAVDAWTIAAGGDVLLGMFDDACDVNHDDLRSNYIGVGHDPTLLSTNPDSNNPEPKQIGDRHGTAVMGLAAAAGNEIGGRGVAFLSRFTVSRGAAEFTTAAQKASVYTFARQQSVDVHINSWGLDEDEPIPSVLEDAINTAFFDGRDPDGEGGAAPARGMVVVFAAGNFEDGANQEPLVSGETLATLNSVIGVGASTNADTLASYSKFGPDIDFLAPGGVEGLGMLTTDNTDDDIVVEDGFNISGLDLTGNSAVDGAGLFTEEFLGTSASCPLVAGTAAIMLSENPGLTAIDVRIVMEHTCDLIDPNVADYDNITGRSSTFGYGRVNAFGAVQAASEALENGGLTWPSQVRNLSADADDLSWNSGRGTREFLVIESTGAFTFDFNAESPFPVDGVCYSNDQLGCSGSPVAPLPAGVTLTSVTTCEGSNCGNNENVVLEDVAQPGRIYAVYGRSGIGRYSWGTELLVEEDSDGDGPGDGGPVENRPPNVTIAVSLTEGVSPLTVQFVGNAERVDADIDPNRVEWDFDLEAGLSVDAATRNATYTYEVDANETRTFIARLTMYDADGTPGTAQVAIRVEGPDVGDFAPGAGNSNVRILVGIPGSVDSDVSSGISPFDVLLSVDSSNLVGELLSVEWDLGDGSTSNSLVVPHTYTNFNDANLRIPITARITTRTSLATTQIITAERVVTVFPGEEEVGAPGPTPLPPGAGTGGDGDGGGNICGAVGILPMSLMLMVLGFIRRRRM